MWHAYQKHFTPYFKAPLVILQNVERSKNLKNRIVNVRLLLTALQGTNSPVRMYHPLVHCLHTKEGCGPGRHELPVKCTTIRTKAANKYYRNFTYFRFSQDSVP